MLITKRFSIIILTFTVGLLIFLSFEAGKIKRYVKSILAEKPHHEEALVIIDSARRFATGVTGQYYLLRVKLEKEAPLPVIEFSKAKGRNLVINLETWPGKLLVSPDFNVLEAVSNGDFDKALEEFCLQVKRLNVPVFVRFNPEMELPLNEYPWQYQSGSAYIKAFRRVASICRKEAPVVRMMWGPAGYAGADEYWPGSDCVDAMSMTLNKNDLEKSAYPHYASVKEMLCRKLHRLRFFQKPVLVLGKDSMNAQVFLQAHVAPALERIQQDRDLIYQPLEAAVIEPGDTLGKRNLLMGAYDPQMKLVHEPALSVEHFFPNLTDLRSGSFRRSVDSAMRRDHDVVVTFEPWRDVEQEKDGHLFVNILAGRYDAQLNQLRAVISSLPRTVYLRWTHEMEIPVDRYPWQQQDPSQYIKVYRYIAERVKAPNVKLIWGPAGDRGCMEWWPGADVVDYVSIAIYGLPDKNISDHTRQLSFGHILKMKYHRLRFSHKPVFITEFGVRGPENYKREWLKQAAAVIRQYPDIVGISYFNFMDTPNAWGNIETPDWGISQETFRELVSNLPVTIKTPHLLANTVVK